MKRAFCFLTLAIILSFVCWAIVAEPKEVSARSITISQIVIRYGNVEIQEDGKTWSCSPELVFDKRFRRVILQVEPEDVRDVFGSTDRHGKYLELLKAEVIRLVSSETPVPIGDRFSFYFRGGYPIWGPHSTFSKQGSRICLFFAEDAEIIDNVIYASGQPRVAGHYPYPHMPILRK